MILPVQDYLLTKTQAMYSSLIHLTPSHAFICLPFHCGYIAILPSFVLARQLSLISESFSSLWHRIHFIHFLIDSSRYILTNSLDEVFMKKDINDILIHMFDLNHKEVLNEDFDQDPVKANSIRQFALRH